MKRIESEKRNAMNSGTNAETGTSRADRIGEALASLPIAICAAAMIVAIGLALAVPQFQRPAPAMAQDTSIAKQVAETIVYNDQEQSKSVATLIQDVRDEASATAAVARANNAYKHSAKYDRNALSQTIDETAIEETEREKTAREDLVQAVDTAINDPQENLSHEESVLPDDMIPATISVKGDIISYIDYYYASAAPKKGAGLWMGSDSTTDGSWGYFIGHNPGDFTAVMTLVSGDTVSVCDRDGNVQSYKVVDAFTVPDTAYFQDIEDKINGYGESIVLQTCCGDNAHYRVVVADAVEE